MVFALLLAMAVTLGLQVGTSSLDTLAVVIINLAGLIPVLMAVSAIRTRRLLGREHVQFLQYGILVVPEIATVPKPGSRGRQHETHFSYAYTVGDERRVHTIVKPYPQPLWSPYQLLYDPSQPDDPRVVRLLYPDLVVEEDQVRLR